ncbi:TetR family transcriptional regulator C-terminal domain-containing protein [Rhodoglobus vestalii]|uniref:TetR family transcriptional regulator C-terminal domain-containing protein n=1 Tax=Rhodoglobus vestalii TaxID=193384 RepID=UPI003CCC5C89
MWVFSGGCFFAAASAELGSRKGPLPSAVAQLVRDWHEFVRGAIERGDRVPLARPCVRLRARVSLGRTAARVGSGDGGSRVAACPAYALASFSF